MLKNYIKNQSGSTLYFQFYANFKSPNKQILIVNKNGKNDEKIKKEWAKNLKRRNSYGYFKPPIFRGPPCKGQKFSNGEHLLRSVMQSIFPVYSHKR